MKILIINQATRNHGDEAACLGLVRTLYKNNYKKITISYNDYGVWNSNCFIKYSNIKQIESFAGKRYINGMLKLFFMFPNFFTNSGLLMLFSDLRKEYKQIKQSDYVISAPGGPNLGKYKDLRYLWRAYTAYKLGKKYAFYSPSIGPFPKDDKSYTKMVTKILRNADFLSLRDKQSYIYAEELEVKFQKSIDTAFLETQKNVVLPKEVKTLLPEKYVVIVPHELYKWHMDFKNYTKETFEKLYHAIIDVFLNNGHKVVLLPQTFESRLNDEGYFNELKSNNPNVIVIPTSFSSDIQQKVIANADFVVGARYHTIVFSINNQTHFYCLSYEHKMIDMLKILGLESNSINIKDALANPIETAKMIYKKSIDKEKSNDLLVKACCQAKKIADECFMHFKQRLKKC